MIPASALNMVNWCIERHKATNHFYDKYLPYEFHLRMTVQVAYDFKNLAEEHVCARDVTWETIVLACWGHDLIEDTRTSYNDVAVSLGHPAANIIYALTNEKGRNRKERGNEKYYYEIRHVRGADFCKLCDRIANVQYSKMTKSNMFGMYKKENDSFLENMGYHKDRFLKPMFDYLINLFE